MTISEGVPDERTGASTPRRTSLHRLARTLADTPRFSDAAAEVSAAIAGFGGWDIIVIWAVVPFSGTLQCLAYWELSDRPALRDTVRVSDLRPGSGPVGEAWATATTVVIDDLSTRDDGDAPVARAAVRDGLRSAIVSPIAPQGEVLGIVMACSDSASPISKEAVVDLEILASMLALSFGQERARRNHALDKAVLSSQNEATLDALLVVGPDGSIISHNTRFKELWNLSEEVLGSGSDDDAVAAVLDQVAHPEAFVERIRHLYSNPDEHGHDEIALSDGRLIDRWTLPQRDPDTGVLIGRAWFFRDVTEQRRIERQDRFLADLTDTLTDLDTTDAIGDLAAKWVPTLADWCVIDLVEGPFLRRAAVATVDPAKVADTTSLGSLVPFDPEAPRGPQHVIRTGKPEFAPVIEDAWLVEEAGGDDEMLASLRALKLRSYVCLPLRARGRTLGAITLVTEGIGRTLGERDLAFAQTVADRTALLFDSSRLFRERDHIARTLQESLLPSTIPEVPGVQIRARIIPGGEAYDVGGDFYDVFRIGAGSWAVAIGDVCGKGPEAAALTALARNTIRIAAMQARRPKRMLALLNEALLQNNDDQIRFCTATVGRLKVTASGVDVTLSRGGHPESLVLRTDGSLTELRGVGTLLGVVPDPKLADIDTKIGPGETLILHTDGITEARNPSDEPFGSQRLAATLQDCAQLPLEKLIERVFTQVTSFVGGPTHDDMAILAIRATEPSTHEG